MFQRSFNLYQDSWQHCHPNVLSSTSTPCDINPRRWKLPGCGHGISSDFPDYDSHVSRLLGIQGLEYQEAMASSRGTQHAIPLCSKPAPARVPHHRRPRGYGIPWRVRMAYPLAQTNGPPVCEDEIGSTSQVVGTVDTEMTDTMERPCRHNMR